MIYYTAGDKTGFGEVEGEVKVCVCLPASKASMLRTTNFYIILKYVKVLL